MKRLLKKTILFLMALAMLHLSPAAIRAYEYEARWETQLIRAELSARSEMNGQGVRVAVIDSGIAPLSCFPLLLQGADYTGAGSTQDALGHGTFIASIIAALDAEAAFYGIAPGAELIPLRCFDENSGDLNAVIEALYDAVDVYGCDVLALSFGQAEADPALSDAVAYALSRGVCIVASCGNAGSDRLYYPAAYEGVIGVNAVDRAGIAAASAQQNASVALSAPGVRVTGLNHNGEYETRTGSSFAVPFVAGAAAVLLSADDSLTPTQIRDILCQTALDLGEPGWDALYGWGLLDLDAALRDVLAETDAWLSAPKASADGVAVTVYNPGDAPLRGRCRLGEQVREVDLQAGQAAALLFDTSWLPAECAVYAQDGTGSEVRISNVRPWDGATPVFSDVAQDAWYREYVEYAVRHSLMTGMGDGRFGPDIPTSRAMIVTMLYNLEGRPELAAGGADAAAGANGEAVRTNPFTDVAEDQWYAKAVSWASREGVVAGYGSGSFGPNDPITREQFAAIMYSYAKYKGYETAAAADLSVYEDLADVSVWARDALQWACAQKLLSGRTQTTLVPQGRATRAEAAVIFMRFMENVK